MKNKFSQLATKIGLMLGATLLMGLAGCIGYVDRPSNGSVYVAPAPEPVVVVEQDDYVYYPQYEMYYGSRSHGWYYQDGRSWVSRPAPRGASINVVLASPSVRVDFHDRPDAHHAEVVKSYPRNWKPAGGNNQHNEGPQEPSRDDHQNDHKQ